jgi:hypothetical protein
MELTWLVVDNPTSAPKIKALAQKIKLKWQRKERRPSRREGRAAEYNFVTNHPLGGGFVLARP